MFLLLIYHIHNLLKDVRKTFDLMFKALIMVDKTLHWRIRKSDKTYFYLNSLNMHTLVIYSENNFPRRVGRHWYSVFVWYYAVVTLIFKWLYDFSTSLPSQRSLEKKRYQGKLHVLLMALERYNYINSKAKCSDTTIFMYNVEFYHMALSSRNLL